MNHVKLKMARSVGILFAAIGSGTPANYSTQNKIYQTNELDTVQIVVNEGWNLISLPLIVPDGSVKALFPTAISSAFKYEGRYIPCDTLEPGVGYWLKFAIQESIKIIGTLPNYWECISIQKGWNIIGSIDKNISIDKIKTVPEGIFSPTYFEYSNEGRYIRAETLRTGKGYWVKANESGNLWYSEWMKFLDWTPSNLIIDHVQPNIMYILEIGNISENTFGKIMKSTDGGTSWFTILDSVDANGLAIDPTDRDVMYASLGTTNFCSPGILKTTNAGETWFRADAGIYINWETIPSLDIIDPNNTEILYASTWAYRWSSNVSYKSTNGGMSWSVLLNADSLHCGTDSSDTSCLLFTGFGMAIDPNNSNVLYAIRNWEDAILFKSTNGGTSWFIHYIFQDSMGKFPYIVVDPFESDILYVIDTKLRISTDGGNTWLISNSGLPDPIFGVMILSLSREPGVLYLNYDLKIYKSTNCGNNWNLFDSEITFMRALDENNGFIYAEYKGGIYKLKIKNCLINK